MKKNQSILNQKLLWNKMITKKWGKLMNLR